METDTEQVFSGVSGQSGNEHTNVNIQKYVPQVFLSGRAYVLCADLEFVEVTPRHGLHEEK